MLQAVARDFDEIHACDINPHMIALWTGVQDGSFTPPVTLDRTAWEACRKHWRQGGAPDALTGFAGCVGFFRGRSLSGKQASR